MSKKQSQLLAGVVAGLFTFCAFSRVATASPSSFGFDSDSSYYRGNVHLTPQDYLYAPNTETHNDLFERLHPIEASVELGIGSDCGRINIDGTLRSTFGRVLSGDYFKGLAQDILASAPMLTACYLSPTWCSILKHTQLSANFLTQTRLNQCQIIDKYTDSRTEDYYRERQSCAQRAIEANGGDMEAAMASCQSGVFDAKAGKWAGATKDNPNAPNALIADSTKWAGFEGPESDRISGILKSMVGDTVMAHGQLRVEYGVNPHPYSPRSYLISLQKQVTDSVCGKLVPDLVTKSQAPGNYVNDADIQAAIQKLPTTSTEDEAPLLTPEVVRNLAYLPQARRERICQKLSQAIAMHAFTRDMNRSLDVLTAASQNPNLPPNRKIEIAEKRIQLKDQIDLTLKLQQEEAKPVGEVMHYIAQEGLEAQDDAVRSNLQTDGEAQDKRSHAFRMNDCSDGIYCSEPPSNINGGMR